MRLMLVTIVTIGLMLAGLAAGPLAVAGTWCLLLYLIGYRSGLRGLRIIVPVSLAGQLTLGWWASAMATFNAVDPDGRPVALITEAPWWLLIVAHPGRVAAMALAGVAIVLLARPAAASHGVEGSPPVHLPAVRR